MVFAFNFEVLSSPCMKELFEKSLAKDICFRPQNKIQPGGGGGGPGDGHDMINGQVVFLKQACYDKWLGCQKAWLGKNAGFKFFAAEDDTYIISVEATGWGGETLTLFERMDFRYNHMCTDVPRQGEPHRWTWPATTSEDVATVSPGVSSITDSLKRPSFLKSVGLESFFSFSSFFREHRWLSWRGGLNLHKGRVVIGVLLAVGQVE